MELLMNPEKFGIYSAQTVANRWICYWKTETDFSNVITGWKTDSVLAAKRRFTEEFGKGAKWKKLS